MWHEINNIEIATCGKQLKISVELGIISVNVKSVVYLKNQFVQSI